MAVIKNQKTGMWEVRTYYKDWTGERKQKTKRGFAKKSEVLEWERNFKLKEDQSISMTFGSFVEIYLKDLESRIKKNTLLTKKQIIETKILPYFGRRKLDEIRTCDVIQWQNEMMKLTKEIRRNQTEFKWEQDKAQKKLDDTLAENLELETEGHILQLKNSRLQTEYCEVLDKLTDKKNEIEIAEKETDK